MSTPANTPFTVIAEIRDPDGDVCANGEADVPCVISLDNIPSGSEGAVLSGTTTKTPVNGVLTFDDLEIDLDGEGYTLKVQPVTPIDIYPVGTGSLAQKVSGAFSIGGGYTLVAVDLSSGGTTLFGKNTVSGSITPDVYLGSIRILTSGFVSGSEPPFFVTFSMAGGYSQDSFTSITIGGVTLLTADAYSFTGFTTWDWESATNPIPSAGTYTVTFA